jgi:hypothetical protein
VADWRWGREKLKMENGELKMGNEFGFLILQPDRFQAKQLESSSSP